MRTVSRRGRPGVAARSAFQKYWYDTAAQDVVGAREALTEALKTAEPYTTTPNWATVSALFQQYAPPPMLDRIVRERAGHDPEAGDAIASAG